GRSPLGGGRLRGRRLLGSRGLRGGGPRDGRLLGRSGLRGRLLGDRRRLARRGGLLRSGRLRRRRLRGGADGLLRSGAHGPGRGAHSLLRRRRRRRRRGPGGSRALRGRSVGGLSVGHWVPPWALCWVGVWARWSSDASLHQRFGVAAVWVAPADRLSTAHLGIRLLVALRHPLQCLLRVDPGLIGPTVLEAGHTSSSVSTRVCLRHQLYGPPPLLLMSSLCTLR